MPISSESSVEITGSGSISALNGSVLIPTTNVSAVLISVSGTWSGTLIVEGSVDGTNWFTWYYDEPLTGVRQSTTSSNKQLWVTVAGVLQMRVRSSDWVSGTAVLNYNADSGSVVSSNVMRIAGGTDGAQIGNRRDALKIIGADELTDAGQRLRVSNLTITDALTFYESPQTLKYSTKAVAGGTASHVVNASAIRLTTTTGATDSITWQTKRYYNYTAGISHTLGFGVVLGAKKSNVLQRAGYFDDNNGFFIEQDSSNLKIILRTNTSGSPIDTAYNQSVWNIDKLDGTGASGITLDTSKLNIFVVDFLWHGAGTIRFGIRYSNTIVYFHEINNANANTVVFTRRPSLPIRVELTNTGVTASSTNLDLTSYVISKESIGDDPNAYFFTASTKNIDKSINNTTPLPLISIRPKLNFTSAVNHVSILLQQIEVMTVQNSVYVQLLLNPTLTGASWQSVATQSAAEYDTAATSVTGGLILFETYVVGGGKGGNSLGSLLQDIALGVDINNVQDTVTLAAAKINGNSDTLAILGWSEFQ